MSSIEMDPAGLAALEQQSQEALLPVNREINEMLAQYGGEETVDQLVARAAAILRDHNLEPDEDGLRATLADVLDEAAAE